MESPRKCRASSAPSIFSPRERHRPAHRGRSEFRAAARRYAAQAENGEHPWNTIDPPRVDAATIERTPVPPRLTESIATAPVVHEEFGDEICTFHWPSKLADAGEAKTIAASNNALVAKLALRSRSIRLDRSLHPCRGDRVCRKSLPQALNQCCLRSF